MCEAPRIFFSYASDDVWWVEAFKLSAAFTTIGNVKVLDYSAEDAGYGPLKEALDKQINRSSVVIAFVSADYTKKTWTVAEWESSLSEAQRRRLVFVPIMLDADAKVWWERLRNQGKLGGLSRDYAYVSFVDGAGNRLLIRPEDAVGNEKIAHLVRQIKKDLEIELPAPSEHAVVVARPPSNDGPDAFVLGHPSSALPPELAESISRLCESLKSLGLRTEAWRDGWKRRPEARGSGRAASGTIFIQPVGENEAADLASDPGSIGRFLDAAGFAGARVALWLPKGFRDADFDAAAARMTDATQFPAIRTDSAEDLAAWTRGFKVQSRCAKDTTIQVKSMGFLDDSAPPPSVAPQQVVDQLKDQIKGIATKYVIPQPLPPWEFFGETLRDQLKRLPGDRTIIAIHDLDVTPDSDEAIEKQLQTRFEEILEAVEEEQEDRAKNRRPPLNAFLAALLVRSASALPFHEYPYDSRYGQWRILGFMPPNVARPGEAPPLKPKPDSLAVFQQKLFSWAHSGLRPN
jgi:hypothetical protein